MNKIEKVRGALTKALGFTDSYQTHGLDERYRAESSDVYDKLRAALAILKDIEAQKPVAAFGEDTDHICDLLMQLHGEFYGKDKAHADAFRALPKVVAFIKAHPSPSAPVDIAEVIAAGEELIRCHRGFHEAIAQHTGNPYPWEPMESAVDQWTTATAKHRTALEGPKNQGNTSNADEYR